MRCAAVIGALGAAVNAEKDGLGVYGIAFRLRAGDGGGDADPDRGGDSDDGLSASSYPVSAGNQQRKADCTVGRCVGWYGDSARTISTRDFGARFIPDDRPAWTSR